MPPWTNGLRAAPRAGPPSREESVVSWEHACCATVREIGSNTRCVCEQNVWVKKRTHSLEGPCRSPPPPPQQTWSSDADRMEVGLLGRCTPLIFASGAERHALHGPIKGVYVVPQQVRTPACGCFMVIALWLHTFSRLVSL